MVVVIAYYAMTAVAMCEVSAVHALHNLAANQSSSDACKLS